MDQLILKADINLCEFSGQINSGEVEARTLTVEMCDRLCSCAMAFVTFETADGTMYESKVTDGKAKVPLFEKSQFIKIGLYSADIEGDKCIKRYSPKPANAYVNVGSYKEDSVEPPIPTPSTYAELKKYVEDLVANIEGGLDVLQELNQRLDNEPNKVYSANVINKDIVAPVTEHIKKLYEELENVKDDYERTELASHKVREFNIVNRYTEEQYPNMQTALDMCGATIEVYRAEVNRQIENLKSEVGEMIGGIDNGLY